MSESKRMPYGVFVDMASNVVYGLVDRISQDRQEFLIGETEEGIQQPDYFMKTLLGAVVKEQIPITPAERDTIVLLMREENLDLGVIDQFNVVSTDKSSKENLPEPDVRIERHEFIRLATGLVRGFRDRLDEHEQFVLQRHIREGMLDPRGFVDFLLGRLLRDRMPISATERDIVVRLMTDQKVNLTPVAKFRLLDDEPDHPTAYQKPKVDRWGD